MGDVLYPTKIAISFQRLWTLLLLVAILAQLGNSVEERLQNSVDESKLVEDHQQEQLNEDQEATLLTGEEIDEKVAQVEGEALAKADDLVQVKETGGLEPVSESEVDSNEPETEEDMGQADSHMDMINEDERQEPVGSGDLDAENKATDEVASDASSPKADLPPNSNRAAGDSEAYPSSEESESAGEGVQSESRDASAAEEIQDSYDDFDPDDVVEEEQAAALSDTSTEEGAQSAEQPVNSNDQFVELQPMQGSVAAQADGSRESLEDAAAGERERVFHMDDFTPSHVYTFAVKYRQEECFFVDINFLPSVIRLAYFVSSGGSLNINFRCRYHSLDSAKPEILKAVADQSEFVVNLRLRNKGQHSFCFKNDERNSQQKLLTFAINLDANNEHAKRKLHARDSHFTSLSENTRELRTILKQLEAEQTFLKDRTTRHLMTQDSTEWRVTYYTIFESVFIILVAVVQVAYVQRLINQRRWV